MKKINFIDLCNLALNAYTNKISFIIFKKPNDNIIYLCLDKKKINKNSNLSIIIGDFENNKKIKIFNSENYYSELIIINYKPLKNIIFKEKNNIKNFNIYKKNFLLLVNKALKLIKKNFLKKVVLSRKVVINYNFIDFKNTINNLLYKYPECFTNIWYHYKHGLWLGATPELLFNISNNHLITTALAGTIKLIKKKYIPWNFKEIEEHNIIIDYISNILNNYKGIINIHNTKSINLGLIKHLKTDIDFFYSEINSIPNYKEILKYIHPTPAVCGMPKNIAYDFIKKNEGYKRSFYTGYIGIIKKNKFESYVNIRCMNIKNNNITIYAGCGITNKSIPIKEWIESEIKIQNIVTNLVYK